MSFKSGDLVIYTHNGHKGLAWVNSDDLGVGDIQSGITDTDRLGRYRIFPINRDFSDRYLFGLHESQMVMHTRKEDIVHPFSAFEVLDSLDLTSV